MVKGYGFRTCMGVTNKVKIENLILGVFRVRFFSAVPGVLWGLKFRGIRHWKLEAHCHFLSFCHPIQKCYFGIILC